MSKKKLCQGKMEHLGTFGDGDRMSHSISLNNIVNNIYSYYHEMKHANKNKCY